ncbi:MAG: DNA-3-methyladenine glycosylase [Anaerolineaceae bacterium]|nr:DNA-3-methyladenine glycosylase [Anaerolineaceae bacterium]
MFTPLPRIFFQKSAVEVAPALLGKTLYMQEGNQQIAGIISECEAYQGERDLACHARAGKTARTLPMYGKAGHAYIYFTYGIHWMFNIVTDCINEPAAVLIRAIVPILGFEIIAERRAPQPKEVWTNGPAKVCQAFNIDKRFNQLDMCQPDSPIRICKGIAIPPEEILQSARIGINQTPEPWLSIPWRFYLAENSPCLSVI